MTAAFFCEPIGVIFDHVEGVLAELVHYAGGGLRSDPLYGAGREIAQNVPFRFGHDPFEEFALELNAVYRMIDERSVCGDPVALGQIGKRTDDGDAFPLGFKQADGVSRFLA